MTWIINLINRFARVMSARRTMLFARKSGRKFYGEIYSTNLPRVGFVVEGGGRWW